MGVLMKFHIFILMALFLSFELMAKVYNVRVQGLDVELSDVSFSLDLSRITSGQLVAPHEFNFADGNVIRLKDYIWLNEDGNITLAVNPGLLSYKLPKGVKLILDCQERRHLKMNRLVSFHANKRYHRNCELLNQHVFQGVMYSIDARWSSQLDLNSKGGLEYSSRNSSSSWVSFDGKKRAYLRDRSAVAIHENGNPRFFTLKSGEELSFGLSNGEVITAVTDPQNIMAITVYENGNLQSARVRGKISLPGKFKSFKIDVNHVHLYKSGDLGVVNIKSRDQLPSELQKFVIEMRGANLLCFSMKGEPKELSYCKESL